MTQVILITYPIKLKQYLAQILKDNLGNNVNPNTSNISGILESIAAILARLNNTGV